MQLSTILAFTISLLVGHIMANPMNLRRRDVCCESGSEYKDICCAEFCLAIGKAGNTCEANKCACK